MSIDALQEKIRKRKCPLIVDMTVLPKDLPGEGSIGEMEQLSKELLRALRGRVPGVRFRLSALALMGPEALDLGKRLTQEAQGLGFYVLLDVPEADSGELAAFAAELDKLPDWVEVCRQRAEAEARERASRGL